MARIVVISSHVAYGNVGGTAGSFILRRLGHDVWFLPTIILSNHPGHANFARTDVDPKFLAHSLDTFQDNGWARSIDAVMTGYLPSAQHVAEAEKIVTRLKSHDPDLLYFCDPILGDDPLVGPRADPGGDEPPVGQLLGKRSGLYIAEDAASAIRSELLPKADILTPNRFELEWLTGRPVSNVTDALSAARALDAADVIVTSLPDGGERTKIADLYVSPGKARLAEWQRRENVPHGSGDAMAALLLGHRLGDHDLSEAFALSVAGTRALITEAAVAGADSLPLENSQDLWAAPKPAELIACD